MQPSPPPTAQALARILERERSREAVDAVRGYEWQRWLTAEAWLQLGEDGALWIEWAEDFTVVDNDGVRTIQAKDRRGKVTLGRASVQEAISQAFERGDEVRTVYWTTSEPGAERSTPFGEPGIVHWRRVQDGTADPAKLKDFLATAPNLSGGARAAVSNCANDADFRRLLQRMEWITGEGDVAALRARVERLVAARMIELTASRIQVIRKAALADRIVAEVTRTGLRQDAAARRLTADDLKQLLGTEYVSMLAAAAPTLQAVAGPVGGEALRGRVARLRRAAGFQARHEDQLEGWRSVAAELLAGAYDDVPSDVWLEAMARTAWSLADPEVGDLAQQLLSRLEGAEETEVLRLARLNVLSHADMDAAMRRTRDLTSPEGLGLHFQLMLRAQGPEAALEWALPRPASAFSSIGAFLVALHLMTLGRWAEVLAFSEGFTVAQKLERPILHAFRGFALMADVTLPHEREHFLEHPMPLRGQNLRGRFVSDHARLAIRLPGAVAEFREAQAAAEALDAGPHIVLFRDLQMWLELENPATHDAALGVLKRRLAMGEQFPSSAVFAAVYGVEFDRAAARHQLESRIALGGLELPDLRAMFVLFEDPEAELAALERHEAAVVRFMGAPTAAAYRVELLIRAGRLDEAEQWLDAATAAFGADDPNFARLRAGIRTERGDTTSEEIRSLWLRTGELDDLHNLCLALNKERRWPALAEAVHELARRTRLEPHICWLLDAHQKAHAPSKMLAALEDFASEVATSEQLRTARATLLIGAGRYLEARVAMQELLATPGRGDDPRDDGRLLEIAVETGDWEGIVAVADRVWERRDNRSARSLTEASVLAMERGLEHRARELAEAAAAKPDAEARVFITIWLVAHAQGRELEWPHVGDWFGRASALSGPKGPVWQTTLTEAAEMMPKQAKARAEVSERMNRAEAPMFAVAEAMNATLTDLLLGSATRNRVQRDPRKRWMIPTVRGGRAAVDLASAKVLAMDLTTLLVLQSLRMLPKVLERFDVVLPTGTVKALFTDRQQLILHAPRQAKAAMEMLRLVGEGKLTPVALSPCKDVELVGLLGEDLADLLEYARTVGARVCRPSPVHKAGSLLMEPVDMAPHAKQLCSTHEVYRLVEQAGRLPRIRLDRARAHLERVDQGWADTPALKPNAPVILDELALSHLQTSGLLEEAIEVFGTLLLPQGAVEAARADVALGRMVDSLFAEIDELRITLRNSLSAGRVRYAEPPDDPDPQHAHPVFRLLRISDADAVAIDDRNINGSGFAETSGGRKPIVTSLDILEALGIAEILDEDALRRAATDILRCGYFLTPITLPRLMRDLATAVGPNGFYETAELRAIREYVQRLQMVVRVVDESEASYFDVLGRTFIEALKGWWAEAPDLAAARAGADWLWSFLPDPRAFTHVWIAETSPKKVEPVRVAQLAGLLFPRFMEGERLAAYGVWAEERIAAPLAAADPELFGKVADQVAAMVARFDKRASEIDA